MAGLARLVFLILGGGQQRRRIGAGPAKGLDPRPIDLVKVGQHPAQNHVLVAGMAHAHARTAEVRTHLPDDRAQAIVTRRPAAGLHAEPSGGQIHLVMEHHDLIERGFIEFGGGRDRAATFVHIGLGLHQQGAHLARRGQDIALADLALKLGAPRPKAPTAGHLIDG
ncbi:MAG: hypothetical protein RLZZ141_1653 [Pseudomonadota bacterium]